MQGRGGGWVGMVKCHPGAWGRGGDWGTVERVREGGGQTESWRDLARAGQRGRRGRLLGERDTHTHTRNRRGRASGCGQGSAHPCENE